MKKSFGSKIVVLIITVSLLMSVFSTNIHAYSTFFLASDVISEEDIINTGTPIGKWNCNEASGTTVKDSSGNGMHGKLYENYTMQDRFKWVLGRERSAVAYNPMNDSFVVVPTNARFNYRKTGSYTLMAWIKSDGDQNRWQGVITKGRHLDQWYGIWISSGNRWVYGGQDGNNIHGSTVTDGWHFVVIVQDGAANKRYLYVDGYRVGAGVALDAYRAGPLVFGKAGGLDSENFKGAIDEVYLYNYAWSSGDIFEWYRRMENTLNVPVYGQQKLSICWATSSAMVSSYFDQRYGDYDIQMAQYVHGENYNKGGTHEDKIKAVKKFTYTDVEGKIYNRSLSFDEVRNQIDNKQPFIASIKRSDGARHAVVIRGYFINLDSFTAFKREYIRMNNPVRDGFTQLLYYPHFLENSRYKWVSTTTFTRS